MMINESVQLEGTLPTRKGMHTFLLIWLGQLISILGSGLSSFALGVWIYQQTGQATPFALTILFGNLPRLLMMPLAGSLADRWNRRIIMILSDTGAALGSAALAFLVFFGSLQVWHIYLIVFFSSIFSAFQEPAYMASITMLVSKKDFARANGMVQTGQAISSVVTPLLAGILFVMIGLQGLILIDLATFFIAVIPLLIVRIPQPVLSDAGDGQKKTALKDFALGWNFIRTRGGLLGLLMYYAMVNFLLNFATVLIFPLILSVHSAAVLGSVQTTMGAGMLAGGILMSVWGGPKTRRIPKVIGYIALAVSGLILAGWGTHPFFPGAGFFIMLFFIPIAAGTSMAIWQSKVPADLQGRVFSVRALISQSMMPLAFLTSGPLADSIFEPLMRNGGALAKTFLGSLLGTGPGRGIGLMFVLAGLTAVIVSGLAYMNKNIREIETELPDRIEN
jgi:DHA3 family macrolide efflux protein-like MFS transporter